MRWAAISRRHSLIRPFFTRDDHARATFTGSRFTLTIAAESGAFARDWHSLHLFVTDAGDGFARKGNFLAQSAAKVVHWKKLVRCRCGATFACISACVSTLRHKCKYVYLRKIFCYNTRYVEGRWRRVVLRRLDGAGEQRGDGEQRRSYAEPHLALRFLSYLLFQNQSAATQEAGQFHHPPPISPFLVHVGDMCTDEPFV